MPGTIVDASDQPIGPIRDGDSVIFFNFRSDRARQLTRALALDDFDGFERSPRQPIHMTTMTQYDRTFTFPVVFPPQSLTGSFAEVMAAQNMTNLRVAETEKYPHVSYFFNCGIEKPYPGEDRILVPSPKVPTYDLQPEMSAKGITDNLVERRRRRASTTSSSATSRMPTWSATPARSTPRSRPSKRSTSASAASSRAVRDAGGTLIVTADHGNAEEMWNAELNEPHTAHTMQPGAGHRR